MNNQPRPFVLAETNYKEIVQHKFDIAVLPWGATEAHNYHLPYGTDNYQVDHIAYTSAEKAWKKGTKVLVMPTIPFGVNTGQLDVPFCINMNPSTQLSILLDVCDVLVGHNITKLVILNGHGANNFVAMIRELAGKFPNLFVCVVNWFTSHQRTGIFVNKGDHADEMETSVMMHLHPEILLPLSTAGDGATRSFSPQAFKEGWAWAQRPWSLISNDTGSGDPALATPEKGKEFTDKCSSAIADLFCDLDKKRIEEILS